MVNCKITFSKQMYKELLKNFRTVSLVLLIIGSIGVAAAIALSLFFDWADLLLFFAVPFAFGLILTLSYNKTLKNCNESVTNEYLFEEDYVMITSAKNGEVFATQKMNYSEVKKVAERDNFLFVYQANNTALPIEKASVSEEDYAEIKRLVTSRLQSK